MSVNESAEARLREALEASSAVELGEPDTTNYPTPGCPFKSYSRDQIIEFANRRVHAALSAGGDEAKKSEGGKHSPVKDEYLDGVMEKAKISPLIEYGTGWAKIHFKRELTDQDRENIVRALKTPSDPPDRCEIVARIIDPDAYEPINEARWEGLARLESQAEAQLSAECKARKILATLDGGR